jgi:hypothetical protein
MPKILTFTLETLVFFYPLKTYYFSEQFISQSPFHRRPYVPSLMRMVPKTGLTRVWMTCENANTMIFDSFSQLLFIHTLR